MISKTSHVHFAKNLVYLLDMQFSVFGFKFGIDPLFDLIPVVGNSVSTVASCYLFYIAYLYKVPRGVYGKMIWHIFLDYVIGSIPFLGFFGDFLYRANGKNWELLSQYIDPEILVGEVV